VAVVAVQTLVLVVVTVLVVLAVAVMVLILEAALRVALIQAVAVVVKDITEAMVVLEDQASSLFLTLAHNVALAEQLQPLALIQFILSLLVELIRLNKGDSNEPFCKSSRR
jgi:hypothetical protein